MEFKHYFNAYDTVGTQHTGFLQSMDFSALTGSVTFLNELTMAMMDAYLYNELSGSLVMRHWTQYMHYSRENERFEIMSQFYTDFVNALAAKLIRAEKWYQLTKIDFQSLSATDIKTIEHGTKETIRNYDEVEKTNAYGQHQNTNVYGETLETTRYGNQETTTTYGQDETTKDYANHQDSHVYGATETSTEHGAQTKTNNYGAETKTTEHGATSRTKDYDQVVITITRDQDTHVVGQTHAETDGTTTGQLYPLGGSAFIDDTKQIQHSETDTNAQTNTDTWGDQDNTTAARQDTETEALHTDTESTTAHTDTEQNATYTDTESSLQHTDTVAYGGRIDTETRASREDVVQTDTHTDTVAEDAHTDTQTSGAHTDTATTAAREDTEEIRAYTDTERHTKHIIISPEKYYAIEKELAEIGVYDLMKDAVRETALLCVWEGGYVW